MGRDGLGVAPGADAAGRRVTGSAMIWSLSAGARGGRRLVCTFSAGDRIDGAARAASTLLAAYPILRVAGRRSPRSGSTVIRRRCSAVLARFVEAEPDLGSSGRVSEAGNGDRTAPPVSAGDLGSSGAGRRSTSFAGDQRRAPVWMQRCGLEWAHGWRVNPVARASVLAHDSPYALGLRRGRGAPRPVGIGPTWRGRALGGRAWRRVAGRRADAVVTGASPAPPGTRWCALSRRRHLFCSGRLACGCRHLRPVRTPSCAPTRSPRRHPIAV